MRWKFRLWIGALVVAPLGIQLGASEVGSPTITIRSPDGIVSATLRLSATGDTLLMSLQGQELPLGECDDREIQRVRAAEGLAAIIEERNCGATVDFATRILVQDHGDKHLVAVLEGRPTVSLNWSAGALEVIHSPLPAEHIFRREDFAGSHRIVYSTGGRAAPESQYLDFASFNYGATGRAAGLPAEALQRAAGWAQEASGLHRPEWGTWSREYPYGDDPQGRKMVKDGVEYFECQYLPRCQESRRPHP
jgi:putative RNase toxin 44 of polymorphic toxin system